MNKIEQFLKDNKYNFSLKKYKNVNIYNINDEKMIIVIINKNDNVFSITRDIFNIIDDELLPYSFFLIDSYNRLYFYKINEPNNSIRKAFESCNKDRIYFGKEVLNNKITDTEYKKYIDKI